MATVTGLTADRMLAIEAASVVSGDVDVNGYLNLVKHDGSSINAGYVIGPKGDPGTDGQDAAPGSVSVSADTTIVRTSDGRGKVADPTEDDDAATKLYTDDSVGSVRDLIIPTELDANTDLNTVTSTGTYIQSVDASATTLLNYPVTQGGVLEVFHNDTSSGLPLRIWQRFLPTGSLSKTFFMRLCNENGWVGWQIFDSGTVQDTGWVDASLQNGWTNSGGSYAHAGYRARNGWAKIRGQIHAGNTADQTTLFSIPAEFGPESRLTCVTIADSATNTARIDVWPDGRVTCRGGVVSNSWLSLDVASWPIET